ncbi:MAG: DNA methyltransferase [Dehalococcoidia bacterium]|nr:DNA methyltransferase [Dehalococcoidia bacterium]
MTTPSIGAPCRRGDHTACQVAGCVCRCGEHQAAPLTAWEQTIAALKAAGVTPYFEDEDVVIVNADCRDVLPLLPEGSVDLVLTDPPYGIGKANWDGAIDLSFLWAGLGFLNAPIVAVIPGIPNILAMPQIIGVNIRYRWTLSVRVSNGMTRGAFGFGNWIPCLVYSRDGISLHCTSQDAGEVSTDTHPSQKPNHPSPKPWRAMRWLIERLPGQVILDPFMGSGTTLRAAKDLGRKAIGIEINEAYCQVAVERLRQAVLPLH